VNYKFFELYNGHKRRGSEAIYDSLNEGCCGRYGSDAIARKKKKKRRKNVVGLVCQRAILFLFNGAFSLDNGGGGSVLVLVYRGSVPCSLNNRPAVVLVRT
jgi:hypothetical protein